MKTFRCSSDRDINGRALQREYHLLCRLQNHTLRENTHKINNLFKVKDLYKRRKLMQILSKSVENYGYLKVSKKKKKKSQMLSFCI